MSSVVGRALLCLEPTRCGWRPQSDRERGARRTPSDWEDYKAGADDRYGPTRFKANVRLLRRVGRVSYSVAMVRLQAVVFFSLRAKDSGRSSSKGWRTT
jgi:hypothetical protein